MNVDDMTGAERPRTRRLVSIFAVLVPVIVLAGASAWFIRAYVMPPMINIAAVVASADATAKDEPQSAASPETTGTAGAPTPPEPAVRYTNDTAAIWASVPLPGPPRQVQSFAAVEPEVAAGEAIAGPIPLPPPRPRVSTAIVSGGVPLPRPRPASN